MVVVSGPGSFLGSIAPHEGDKRPARDLHVVADHDHREAQRLGFTSVVLPEKNLQQLQKETKITGIKLYGAGNLTEALRYAMPKE